MKTFEKDLLKVPKSVKDKVNVVLAEKIDDVLENALIGVEI